MPTACDERADADNYSSDETSEQIKVLKQRCDEPENKSDDRKKQHAADTDEPVSEDDE